MKKVWLSTTYYLDPKMAGASAATERMFSRLLAYCGNAETGGIMPVDVHKLVGLPRGKSAVEDLVRRGVLEHFRNVSDALSTHIRPTFDADSTHIRPTFDVRELAEGYRFAGWRNWQDKGDKLVERQKADRERKRKERERKEQASRDMSRDVTPTEERRGEEISTYVDKASHLSNAPDPETTPPRGPSINGQSWALVRDTVPDDHPHAVRTDLALRANSLISAGTPAETVREALTLWVTKRNVGPGILPSLVSEVIKSRIPTNNVVTLSTADQRVAQAQSLKNLGHPTHLELP